MGTTLYFHTDSRSYEELDERAKRAAAVFETQGIELISLRENIDTSSATGRGFLAIMGAITQMEHELKAERTAAGRAAAN